jgi:hypothetical protein
MTRIPKSFLASLASLAGLLMAGGAFWKLGG